MTDLKKKRFNQIEYSLTKLVLSLVQLSPSLFRLCSIWLNIFFKSVIIGGLSKWASCLRWYPRSNLVELTGLKLATKSIIVLHFYIELLWFREVAEKILRGCQIGGRQMRSLPLPYRSSFIHSIEVIFHFGSLLFWLSLILVVFLFWSSSNLVIFHLFVFHFEEIWPTTKSTQYQICDINAI